MGDLLSRLAEWSVGFVYSFGYLGIGFSVMMGNLHLPFPTGIVLPLAGFLVWQGRFSFVGVFLASTAGAVAGALPLYLLGRCFGEERLRGLIERTERYKLISKIVSTSHLDKADEMFEQHGAKAVVIGYLIPGVGGFISIPAGIKRMPVWGRFIVYTVVGTLPYNAVHILLGWALGSEWQQAEQYASKIMYAVAFIAVAGFFWYLLRQYTRNDNNRNNR